MEVDNRGVAILLGRAHLVVQFRVLGQYVVEGEAARTPDKKQQRSETKVRYKIKLVPSRERVVKAKCVGIRILGSDIALQTSALPE